MDLTKAVGNEKLELATDFLRKDLEEAAPALRVEVQGGNGAKPAGRASTCGVRKPGVEKNFLDREVPRLATSLGRFRRFNLAHLGTL